MSTQTPSDRIESYDYDLPRELIAQHPVNNRIDARLMRIDRSEGSITHHHVRDLPTLLDAGDTLVMNDSRVVPARMMGRRKTTGGRWQGLFLDSDSETGLWRVLTKTRGKLVDGETIVMEDRDARDAAEFTVAGRTNEGHLLLHPRSTLHDDRDGGGPLTPNDPPPTWLARFGRVPIPPYIRDGRMMDADVASYQTVYAKNDGSVAAPTAGLHFTRGLLEELRTAGVATAAVTLHVGIGTFRPIGVSDLSDHQMHQETIAIDAETAAEINERRKRGRTIAVGTTSVRTLESVASRNLSADTQPNLGPYTGPTDLFIRPPFEFNATDAMITNFHLPRSSLLVMVSAFAGRDLILRAYQEAVEEEYRFFSYGDAMLIV